MIPVRVALLLIRIGNQLAQHRISDSKKRIPNHMG